MSLVRFTQQPSLPSLLNDFFDIDWPNRYANGRRSLPAVNVQELERQFLLELAIPGKLKEDFKLSLDEDVLSISTINNSEQNNTEGFTRREFSYHSFKRSFRLPDTVDASGIKAKYEQGILSVELPKKKEAIPQPTKIIAIE